MSGEPGPGRRVPAPVLVAAGAALWGTTGTTQALGPDASTPLQIGTLRNVAGGLALLALVAVLGRAGDLRRTLDPTVRSATAVGIVAIAAYQVLFFSGVDRAGVAVGTLVGIGSAPVSAGLIVAALGRPPGRRWLGGTALTLAGAALLALRQGEAAVDLGGVLLAIGAGAAYAVFTIASKRLLDAGLDPAVVMAATYGGGALVLAPLLVGTDLDWVATLPGVVVVAWLGAVTVALAYVLYARGLARLDEATVASLTLAEPLTATLLAVVLLREPFDVVAALGATLVAAGLLVVSLRRRVVA